ncbi:Elongator subunit elp2 [Cichlidogyrus casuarinus]|uniref:Elongator complex protein 2 n=1 Tax=Cichlidogyrus casuarinus TaxID=1844966 RepID=A0ABD2Q7M2_9PLAT
MDCSTILWKQLKSTDKDAPWLECKRFGTVGDNALGLLDCAFSPSGDYFYVLGLRGNLSIWHQSQRETWTEQPPLLGHFGSVTDLSWGRSLEPKFNSRIKVSESLPYLLTSSLDQTLRLHKQWQSPTGVTTWHEMARPQIHGYDMNAVKSLSVDCYVSGGDEKVVRVFAGCSVESGCVTKGEEQSVAAKQPALSLSNFANTSISSNALIQTSKPNDETRLHLETLWPELKKLYGHNFEIYALDTHPKGTLVASACKSTKQNFADIILWNTSDWTIAQRLLHHQLTVTCLRFSRIDGTHLLAGSRDRTWSVHAQQDNDYKLVASANEHKRIIWSCCWVPDNRCFLTGSRDASIMLWGGIGKKLGIKLREFRDIKEPITALDAISNETINSTYWIAVGVESGLISMLKLSLTEDFQTNIALQMHFDVNKCHFSAPVKALEFNRTEQGVFLASGGEDGIVRVYRL